MARHNPQLVVKLARNHFHLAGIVAEGGQSANADGSGIVLTGDRAAAGVDTIGKNELIAAIEVGGGDADFLAAFVAL